MSETFTEASWPLQQAVYVRLTADAGVKALLGDPARVHDGVPEETIFPYLTLGAARTRDWPGVDGGQEHDLRLTAWSRHGGRGEVKQVIAAVHAALHDASMSVSGFHLVSIRYVFGDTWRLADNETWQGVMRFRAVTHPV
ncbi:DUF3168 domain-containing protein [Aquisalinus flavus]|uniref:DUF3168 domain-containing protein n=1 Tax=Aquisalinus flavus TaxID=1526572 RepID=A0A8J2V369_9PROT|nr:DUF3168 domain-containing protein [Aquisalinus flavus]MBD0426287.1 DUF3168 domain-containing protein [Aquisalinus flavus]UNE48144.1 DUF3168 domain-containing protein [Aquisalinus flavus]GGD09154.1 hypothetical protein GCM10011342_17490 [Aquisalinus flavus]